MITQKAVHRKQGKTGIGDGLVGPVLRAGLLAPGRDCCWCVRGRGLVCAYRVCSLRIDGAVIGAARQGGAVAVSALAVGGGLQLFP